MDEWVAERCFKENLMRDSWSIPTEGLAWPAAS
jgi:hypothetical protein